MNLRATSTHTTEPHRRRRACARATALLALLSALASFPSRAAAELRVVSTTTDLGAIARAIGGDAVRVDIIAKGGQDPHFIQAKPSYMVTLSRAQLVIAVGLELEVGWLPLLLQGARNPEVSPGHRGYWEAASTITPIDVPSGPLDRSKGDLHALGNPHFWLDPENAKAAARGLAAKLAELDPEHAKRYAEGLAGYLAGLDQATKRWEARMGPLRGARVVSYHATFDYFFRRFGLVPLGYVEEKPGVPAGAAHLASLIRAMQTAHVTAVVHESYYDEATSKLVAARAGAQLLVLPTSVDGAPGTETYEKLIDRLVDALTAAIPRPGGR